MLQPPAGLGDERILAALSRSHGITAHEVTFAPLGEDSWCYRVDDLWVSIRRDLRGHVPAAYELTRSLLDHGLDFVLAALPGVDGTVVSEVDGYPMVVFPYLETIPLGGSRPSAAELSRVVDMLSRVHSCQIAAELPVEAFRLSFEEDLTAAMSRLAAPLIDRGPYSERLHRLLNRHRVHIEADREETRHLGEICRLESGPMVLTHGEPSAPNILRCGGELLLADWGGAMWGPPERDWFSVIRTLDVRPPCRPAFLRFYEIRWRLSEIAEYTTHFLREHADDVDDHAMWQRLQRYLPE